MVRLIPQHDLDGLSPFHNMKVGQDVPARINYEA